MNTSKATASRPTTSSTQPLLTWWQHQWLQSATPLARMQMVWMDSLVEAIQFEAQFLNTMAETGLKMADCFHGEEAAGTPAEMHQCYQKLVQDVTDAHMQRMEKATQLSEEFRQRIWEEI